MEGKLPPFYGAILVIAATLLSAIVLSYAMPEYGWRSPVYKLKN